MPTFRGSARRGSAEGTSNVRAMQDLTSSRVGDVLAELRPIVTAVASRPASARHWRRSPRRSRAGRDSKPSDLKHELSFLRSDHTDGCAIRATRVSRRRWLDARCGVNAGQVCLAPSGFVAGDGPDAIDRLVEGEDLLDAGCLGLRDKIGIREVQAIYLVNLQRTKQRP